MAMTADQYLSSLPAGEQQKVRDSLSQSGSSVDQWYQAAIDAGDPRAVKASGGGAAEENEGGIADWKNAADSSQWLGKRPPSPRELRKYANTQGWSEDFQRYDDRQLARWLQTGGWDVNAGRFSGGVEKPTETGGMLDPAKQGGGGGGYRSAGNTSYGGGGAGGYVTNAPGGGGGGGGAPVFAAPTPESVLSDPSYQFRLQQGTKALEGSAWARGVGRTGGTLKDLMGYGQGLASEEYGNAYNRALQEWQTRYDPWQTNYQGNLQKWLQGAQGDLQKYLQREQNIYGTLNSPPPQW